MDDLTKCDHEMCVNGRVTYCEGVTAKGWPYREREEKCPRCDGRGYALPTSGFYLVRVLAYGDDERVRAVRVENDLAEFTGDDWDLSEECEVVWLCKVAELDGSAPDNVTEARDAAARERMVVSVERMK